MLAEKEIRRTVGEVLKEGIRFLENRGLESSGIVGERLLEGVLHCKRHELYFENDRIVSREKIEAYLSCLDKRTRGIPCQYILEKAEFMDFVFHVTPSVLIPRPETEFLVEKILAETRQADFNAGDFEILDVGTGSGNIAVSLASYLPKVSVWAVDVSDGALAVARQNALKNAVELKIRFLKSDLFKELPPSKRFDMIVSNPPYLSGREMRELPPEVSREPSLALFGGEMGTEFIERFIRDARVFLKPGGVLFFEIGYTQGDPVSRFLRDSGWNQIGIFKDYCGRDRVVKAVKGQS